MLFGNRAAGWTAVGEARGFARSSCGWREHGRPETEHPILGLGADYSMPVTVPPVLEKRQSALTASKSSANSLPSFLRSSNARPFWPSAFALGDRPLDAHLVLARPSALRGGSFE